jgi:hypothetical protein
MLRSLTLEHVGPAPRLALELASRINLLAGDNGLGKTFLLDVAWWALTRTWARELVIPHGPPALPSIAYEYVTKSGALHQGTSRFDREREKWPRKQGRPPIPGLVLYAQVDGGFSVWDPARNYWKGQDPDRPTAYSFSAQEVWNGLPIDSAVKLSNGLIADWASWQLEHGEAFGQLERVLGALSPSPSEPLQAGGLTKVSLSDSRKHPTLKTQSGRDVPLIHASAGVRRIIALAYMLVWSWQEHTDACKLRGEEPVRQIIFLVDEIEAHLHPKWQRRIVPALLAVMDALTGGHDVTVQLVAATHSPLVLASIEPLFDEDQDVVQHLAVMADGEVSLERFAWSKQGDVVNWLVSEMFGLAQGRSLEAERAIEAAEALMRGEPSALPPGLETREAIDVELRRVLAGHDAFWPRWVVWVEREAVRAHPPAATGVVSHVSSK